MAITRSKRKARPNPSTTSKRPKILDDDCIENKLCSDVMEHIFQKLNFRDLARTNLVCSNWHSILKNVERTYAQSHHVPRLLIPAQDYKLGLFNLEEKKCRFIQPNVGFEFEGDSSYVVGSSHGCLIYLDESFNPVVINPLSGSRFQLPQLLEDGYVVLKSSINGDYEYKHYMSHTRSIEHPNFLTNYWLRAHIVHKVILSSNPFHGDNNFCVALIYGPNSELAFFNMEDHSWTRLDQQKKNYSDITFYDNKLYAVEGQRNHVDIWDFRDNLPKKMTTLKLSIPTKSWNDDGYDNGLYWKFYLVESNGKILLVARKIVDHIDADSKEMENPDVTDYFPYGTVSFQVFESDLQKQQWVEVKSLQGRTLFLGSNHSFSVSATNSMDNCIYFTDDCWSRMDSWMYGGHDKGVFNLTDRKVSQCDKYGWTRMQPSPCWIDPKPR